MKKAGLDFVFKNSSPVSNLSFISKVVEKAALNKLSSTVKKMPLFLNFSPASISITRRRLLLTKVQNDILISMDNNKVTLLVLLDLSPAFDTIEHYILLNILQQGFEVVGTALNWFSLMLGPKQCILVVDF